MVEGKGKFSFPRIDRRQRNKIAACNDVESVIGVERTKLIDDRAGQVAARSGNRREFALRLKSAVGADFFPFPTVPEKNSRTSCEVGIGIIDDHSLQVREIVLFGRLSLLVIKMLGSSRPPSFTADLGLKSSIAPFIGSSRAPMVTWARVEKEIAQRSAMMNDLTLTGFKTLRRVDLLVTQTAATNMP
ncbi:MAG: hypothetical protein LBR64_08180 [Dysgonamonadaceae bacterium]|jgi:hypothetical protein|nr:hypothetical protein [Dysgonamonadaceae bacterium]